MRIWYDVSGLYNWSGNFTGIQRVVYNLGRELHKHDAEARFFVFRHGTFQQIDFGELEERLKTQVEVSAEDAAKHSNLRKLHHQAMVGLKASVLGTPLEPPLRSMYGGLRQTYRAARRQRPAAPVSYIFSADDIVVVVDGNWQFGGYADALAAAKEQSKCKLVHYVHDLTAVRNPALVNPGAKGIIGGYFKAIFPFTDLLVAVSESTRRDAEWFAKQLGVRLPETVVVESGDDNISQASSRAAQKPAQTFPESFILAVGTIEIRKNYTALYYTYKLALEKGIKIPHLVIAGKKGWMAEEAYALLTKDTDLKEHVTVLLGPNDRELKWLYDNCLFTVLASLYEGWGLQVAESLMYGKVCISSNTSSMPEVGKDLAVYVSPNNPAEILDNIVRFSSDTKLREKLEAKIKASYKPRLWKNSYSDFKKAAAKLQ